MFKAWVVETDAHSCGQKIIGAFQGINARTYWWQIGIKMHEGLRYLWIWKQKLCRQNWGMPWRRLLNDLGEVLANYRITYEGDAGPCLGHNGSQNDLQ